MTENSKYFTLIFHFPYFLPLAQFNNKSFVEFYQQKSHITKPGPRRFLLLGSGFLQFHILNTLFKARKQCLQKVCVVLVGAFFRAFCSVACHTLLFAYKTGEKEIFYIAVGVNQSVLIRVKGVSRTVFSTGGFPFILC